MKIKSVCVAAVLGVFLAAAGTMNAVELPLGPVVIKTLDYEVGTSYSGGVAGTFYFRNASASYFTDEYGFLTYTGGANQALFDDADTFVPDPISANEDSWGLLRVTDIKYGNVTGTDSTFGDGSDASLPGNFISAGSAYWAEGTSNANNEYLVGMFWGSQDQVVECVVPDVYYRIWATGGQADVFVVTGYPGDPATDPLLNPAYRTDADEFTNWFDRGSDELFFGGSVDYFRFSGDAVDPGDFDGQSEVLISFTRGSQYPAVDGNWWTAPDGSSADMWQSWNIGDPFVYSNGWTGSEDTGRLYAVPEPMMLSLLGLGAWAALRRKRSV